MEIYDNFLQSTTCNSCNKFSLLLDYKTSDIVCSNCGLVMYDRLASSESEEIVYQEDRESGAYSSRMSSQAESKLGAFNTIFQPNLSSSYTKVTKKMASELTSIQMRTNSPQELRAISYIVQIRAMCGKLDLNSSPQVADTAIDIFLKRTLSPSFPIYKKDKSILSLACIYLACLATGHPRLLREVIEPFIEETEIVSKEVKELKTLFSTLSSSTTLTSPSGSTTSSFTSYCFNSLYPKDITFRLLTSLGYTSSCSYLFRASSQDPLNHHYLLQSTLPKINIMEEVYTWCENFNHCDIILKYQPQYYVIASLLWILSILNLLVLNDNDNIDELKIENVNINDDNDNKDRENDDDISSSSSSPSSVAISSSLISEINDTNKKHLSTYSDLNIKSHKSIEDPNTLTKTDQNNSKIQLKTILTNCYIDSSEELVKAMVQISTFLPFLISKKFAKEFSLLQYDISSISNNSSNIILPSSSTNNSSNDTKCLDLRQIKLNDKMSLETINEEIKKNFIHLTSSPTYLNPLKRTYYRIENNSNQSNLPKKKKIRRQYGSFLFDRS